MFNGFTITFLMSDLVGSVPLLVLDLMLLAYYMLHFFPNLLLFLGIIIYITQFIRINSRFLTQMVQRIIHFDALNSQAKRFFNVYQHQQIHSIFLVLDLDRNLLSKTNALIFACHTPLNILVILVLYFRESFKLPGYVYYAGVLGNHFSFVVFYSFAVTNVATSIHANTGSHLIQFQHRLGPNNSRLKIGVMRMYETLHTDDRVAFSIEMFTKVTPQSLCKFLVIYAIQFLMVIPVIAELVQ